MDGWDMGGFNDDYDVVDICARRDGLRGHKIEWYDAIFFIAFIILAWQCNLFLMLSAHVLHVLPFIDVSYCVKFLQQEINSACLSFCWFFASSSWRVTISKEFSEMSLRIRLVSAKYLALYPPDEQNLNLNMTTLPSKGLFASLLVGLAKLDCNFSVFLPCQSLRSYNPILTTVSTINSCCT